MKEAHTPEKDGNHRHAVEGLSWQGRDNSSLEITDVQLKYDVLNDLEDQDSKEYQNDAREKRKGREGEEADIFKVLVRVEVTGRSQKELKLKTWKKNEKVAEVSVVD